MLRGSLVATDELDLSCMISVMQGDAVHEMRYFWQSQAGRRQRKNDRLQVLMLLVENLHFAVPLAGVPVGPRKPIGAS